MKYRFIGKLESVKIENNNQVDYFVKFDFYDTKSIVDKNYGISEKVGCNMFVYSQNFDYIKTSYEMFNFLLQNKDENFIITIETNENNITKNEDIENELPKETAFLRTIKSSNKRTKDNIWLNKEIEDTNIEDISLQDYKGNTNNNIQIEEDNNEKNTSEFVFDISTNLINIISVELKV